MELAFGADGSISASFGRSGIGNGTAEGGPEVREAIRRHSEMFGALVKKLGIKSE